MALHEVEPELEQYGHRIGVLDAFGNRLDISFFGCVNYFLHTLLHLRIGHERMHQFSVDLDVVGLENVEYLEPLLVDAIMFERKSYAQLAHLPDQRFRLLDVFCGVTLRYLYHQARAIELALVKNTLHPGERCCVDNRLS